MSVGRLRRNEPSRTRVEPRAARGVDADGPKVYPSRAFPVEHTLLLLQPSGAKAAPASPAAAQPQTAAPGAPEHAGNAPAPSMGLLGSPFFIILLFAPFIFLMWRRNKKENEARAKLKKGDKVLAGGLIGEVIDIDERVAKVKIAPGVTVQVLANALAPFDDPKKAAEPVNDKAKSKPEKAESK